MLSNLKKAPRNWLTLVVLMLAITACQAKPNPTETSETVITMETPKAENLDTITLGAGCFWCIEAVFLELKGVHSVTSGYMGGQTEDPTYSEVSNGNTGHAEVARIVFDTEVISLDEVLEVFWMTHDPTTLNRQGADTGTQYRSAVFFANDAQRDLAQGYKKELDKSGAFPGPIVTEITPISVFYKAENYHQDYYAQNGEQGYCRMVIRPKLEKFRKVFPDKVRQR